MREKVLPGVAGVAGPVRLGRRDGGRGESEEFPAASAGRLLLVARVEGGQEDVCWGRGGGGCDWDVRQASGDQCCFGWVWGRGGEGRGGGGDQL